MSSGDEEPKPKTSLEERVKSNVALWFLDAVAVGFSAGITDQLRLRSLGAGRVLRGQVAQPSGCRGILSAPDHARGLAAQNDYLPGRLIGICRIGAAASG